MRSESAYLERNLTQIWEKFVHEDPKFAKNDRHEAEFQFNFNFSTAAVGVSFRFRQMKLFVVLHAKEIIW